MPTKPEDVTVAWGQARGQQDMAMERWWHAVYQDMVPSSDGSRLYFLYDQAVEGNGSYQAIVIFDPNTKRFLKDIPLNIQEGRVKYFYLLKPSEMVLFVQNEDYNGDCILWMFSLVLSPDGMGVAQMRQVLQSLNVGADWIICQAYDTRGVLYSYVVPGGNIKNYFDATVFGGVIYLFPSLADENLDFTHVHTIDTEGRTPMRPFATRPDPQSGFPGVRKQCALDIWQGKLFIIGGQFDDPQRGMFRYGDVWSLDLRNLQWQKYSLQLPLLIVEPNLGLEQNEAEPRPVRGIFKMKSILVAVREFEFLSYASLNMGKYRNLSSTNKLSS
uniref:Uncharacterized protein n=1 Tax=Romanomermis culicivorax TaxID=13658 RepID=A0A915IDI2_ROMCU